MQALGLLGVLDGGFARAGVVCDADGGVLAVEVVVGLGVEVEGFGWGQPDGGWGAFGGCQGEVFHFVEVFGENLRFDSIDEGDVRVGVGKVRHASKTVSFVDMANCFDLVVVRIVLQSF